MDNNQTIRTNNNQDQLTYQMCLGVIPGYDSSVKLTPKEALEIAKPIIEERLSEFLVSGHSIHSIQPSFAEYPTFWGCPSGGEPAITLIGKIRNDQKESFEEAIKFVMAELGQSTVTIEYNSETRYSSTYIQNEYKDNKRSVDTLENTKMTSNEEKCQHFEIRINGGLEENGIKLQKAMEEASKEKDAYIITGVVRPGNDMLFMRYINPERVSMPDGEVSILTRCRNLEEQTIFEGTQNLCFAPDNDKYLAAVLNELKIANIIPEEIKLNDKTYSSLEEFEKDISLKSLGHSLKEIFNENSDTLSSSEKERRSDSEPADD